MKGQGDRPAHCARSKRNVCGSLAGTDRQLRGRDDVRIVGLDENLKSTIGRWTGEFDVKIGYGVLVDTRIFRRRDGELWLASNRETLFDVATLLGAKLTHGAESIGSRGLVGNCNRPRYRKIILKGRAVTSE